MASRFLHQQTKSFITLLLMKTTIKCWYSHTILNSTGLDWKMFSKKYRKPFKLIPILCSWSFRYVSHVSQCYTQSIFREAWQCLAESSTVSKDKILKTVFEWRLEVETTCFNGCLILFIMNFLVNSEFETKKARRHLLWVLCTPCSEHRPTLLTCLPLFYFQG